MKKNEVTVGTTYRVKVSGRIQDVRITGANPHGGWDGVNVATNPAVYSGPSTFVLALFGIYRGR